MPVDPFGNWRRFGLSQVSSAGSGGGRPNNKLGSQWVGPRPCIESINFFTGGSEWVFRSAGILYYRPQPRRICWVSADLRRLTMPVFSLILEFCERSLFFSL